jgi:glycosyltransferase involved in cell wall biosynthesis
MKRPDISVIIPALNEELYITSAIQSVLSQEYKGAIEVIIVDNASTDGTKGAVNQLIKYDKRIRLVEEQRRGLPFARQKGADVAGGNYLVFLDADSRLPAGWLRKAVGVIESATDISAAFGPCKFYDGSRAMNRSSLFFQNTVLKMLHWIARVSGRGGIIFGANLIVSRQAYLKTGGFDLSIGRRYGTDVEFARRLGKTGRVVISNQLTVRTSARRFKRLGSLKVFLVYCLNTTWMLLFRRPFPIKYEETR